MSKHRISRFTNESAESIAGGHRLVHGWQRVERCGEAWGSSKRPVQYWTWAPVLRSTGAPEHGAPEHRGTEHRSTGAWSTGARMACIHACSHACIHACSHACMHPCMHASMHPCMHSSLLLCSSAPVLRCSRAPALLCSGALLLRCSVLQCSGAPIGQTQPVQYCT